MLMVKLLCTLLQSGEISTDEVWTLLNLNCLKFLGPALPDSLLPDILYRVNPLTLTICSATGQGITTTYTLDQSELLT